MFRSEKSSVKSIKESRIIGLVLRESAFFATLLMRPTLTPRNSGPFFPSRIEKSLFLTPLFTKARNTALIVRKLKHFFVFFQSVYSDHGSCISPSVVESNPLSTETLNLIEVSTTEVTTLLEELDCSKAPGPDNIPTVVLKRCASALAPSIAALFNGSFANGHFVSAWKTANICPVHKRENKADVTNYRPISLLSILSVNGTTVEMVAKEKDLGITITKHLTWNNHLKAIVSKANTKMGFIKRNCFALLNTKTLILLYTSLVRSYFCYASQVWAPQSIIQDLMLAENTGHQVYL